MSFLQRATTVALPPSLAGAASKDDRSLSGKAWKKLMQMSHDIPQRLAEVAANQFDALLHKTPRRNRIIPKLEDFPFSSQRLDSIDGPSRFINHSVSITPLPAEFRRIGSQVRMFRSIGCALFCL
ncbi:hypothetical protein K449DRAFT_428485 [Hypoxylon sp. EC38]|nr:hypothetical protein K449DRAFT_428485 [Hypoxylon sp. EC38]